MDWIGLGPKGDGLN